MIELAKEFYKFLELEYPIKDIYFTGSLANYNWTSQSDLDVHILFDTDEDESSLLSEYIFCKKDVWSEKHNITIYGYPVELFAKNTEEEHGSKAIYSLLKNQWIKKPSKKNVQIDSESIKVKSADLMNKIDDVSKIYDDKQKYESADKLKNKIKKMRKAALEIGGEYSTENLVFKTLRNNGYLDKLSQIKTSAFDQKMSLSENEDTPTEYGVLMLDFNISNWDQILDSINTKDLYDEPGYGLEQSPHVTVLYGFHENVPSNKIKEITQEFIKHPIEVELTNISLFESKNRPFDVVKFYVSSQVLIELNQALKVLPHTSTFKNYHPHMTIAYLKKGSGKKYIEQLKKPIKITGNKFTFSDKNKNKTEWGINNTHILKIQKGIPGMTDEKIDILKDFIGFTCAKLKIKEPVTVVLKKGRDEFISTTAAYLPSENENHIRAGDRAIVDICRSIGHELTHNRQRELGMFKPGETVQNIGGHIEDQANAIAGILIKDFTHNYGYDKIYETLRREKRLLI